MSNFEVCTTEPLSPGAPGAISGIAGGVDTVECTGPLVDECEYVGTDQETYVDGSGDLTATLDEGIYSITLTLLSDDDSLVTDVFDALGEGGCEFGVQLQDGEGGQIFSLPRAALSNIEIGESTLTFDFDPDTANPYTVGSDCFLEWAEFVEELVAISDESIDTEGPISGEVVTLVCGTTEDVPGPGPTQTALLVSVCSDNDLAPVLGTAVASRLEVTNAGSVVAGAYSVTITNTTVATPGSVGGVPLVAGESYSVRGFYNEVTKTFYLLPEIEYDATGTTFHISVVGP